MPTKSLNDCQSNTFSQHGEDGIVKEILKRTGISSGICVEFGAWDGIALSNAAELWTNGWKAVLIEPDKNKFKTLKKVCAGYDCLCLDDFVTPAGAHSLESILEREKIPFDEIQLLSIDVDGNEYHILKNLNKLHPPIIIVEYNPTIPKNLSVISKEDAFFGSSAKAIVTLAEEKGYKLVAMTKTNCVFVDSSLFHLFSDLDTSFEGLFDPSNLTYLITGYRGSYAFSRSPSFGMTLPLKPGLIAEGSLFFMSHSHLRTRWYRFKDKVKAVLKTTLRPKNIERFRFTKGYVVWTLKGRKSVPPHHWFKWRTIRNAARNNSIEVFIETGTAGGGTIAEMEKHFKKLYSIELDGTQYHTGRARIGRSDKITLLQGDSGVMLKELLSNLDEPAVFWLDAHFSGSGTARGPLDTPIVKELEEIFAHKIRKHAIVIDDMREFNGTNDYPQLDDLKKMISDKAPQYKFRVEKDLMIIEPVAL
jgi:hypothetical protein